MGHLLFGLAREREDNILKTCSFDVQQLNSCFHSRHLCALFNQVYVREDCILVSVYFCVHVYKRTKKPKESKTFKSGNACEQKKKLKTDKRDKLVNII